MPREHIQKWFSVKKPGAKSLIEALPAELRVRLTVLHLALDQKPELFPSRPTKSLY